VKLEAVVDVISKEVVLLDVDFVVVFAVVVVVLVVEMTFNVVEFSFFVVDIIFVVSVSISFDSSMSTTDEFDPEIVCSIKLTQ
jgi:hypothetical protein